MSSQINTKKLKIFGVDWDQLDQHPYILKEETCQEIVFTNTKSGAKIHINLQNKPVKGGKLI